MATLLDKRLFSIVDTDGSIGVGWKANFYVTGTSTRKATYPTQANAEEGTSPNANPIIVPATGRLPAIWLASGQYKCVLTDENDVVKETIDPINAGESTTTDDYVTPEQFGCPDYAAGVNQQSYIQAAIDYCKANGLKGVKFSQPYYELWVTARTSAFTDATGDDGHYLVIDEFACSLISTYPIGTTFLCKGPTGGSTETDYTVLNSATYGGDVIWRGSAIKLNGSVSTGSANPGDAALTHLYMEGITWSTGVTASLNTAWPAHPPSRTPGRENCWDISNKGVFCQNDKIIGNITLIRCGFDGFLGEHIYCGGGVNTNQVLRVDGYTSKNTNGSSFNPNGPRQTLVNGAFCYNVVGVIEGWLGREPSQFVNVKAMKVAGGGELKGGDEYNGNLRTDGGLPWATVDVTMEGTAGTSSIYLGNFIRGDVRLIDMYARVYQQSTSMLVENLNVDLVVTAHQYSLTRAVHYIGYDATATGVKNTTIRLDMRRSAEAQAASRWVNNAFETTASLGSSNYLYVQGYAPGMGVVNSPATNYVGLVDRGVDKSWATFGTSFDPTATASPEWGHGYLRCATFSGGAGVYQVNLPATTLYQDGSEIGITHRTSNSVWVELVDGGTKKALLGYRDSAKFRCNKALARWDLIEAPSWQTATGAVNITATAANAETGPYTITATGIRPYHSYEVRPASTLATFVFNAIRVETDQVKVWFRNIEGAGGEDPAAQNFTVRWGVRP